MAYGAAAAYHDRQTPKKLDDSPLCCHSTHVGSCISCSCLSYVDSSGLCYRGESAAVTQNPADRSNTGWRHQRNAALSSFEPLTWPDFTEERHAIRHDNSCTDTIAFKKQMLDAQSTTTDSRIRICPEADKRIAERRRPRGRRLRKIYKIILSLHGYYHHFASRVVRHRRRVPTHR